MRQRSIGRALCVLVLALGMTVGLAGCGPGKAPPPPVIHDLETVAARIFAGARDESAAMKLLGTQAKPSELKDFLAATKQAENDGLQIFTRVGAKPAATAFEDSLRSYSSGVVVITGHNDRGLLMFDDGTSLDLARLASINPSVKFAVVSCESAIGLEGGGIGLLTKVASDVAALTESKFVSKVRTLEAPSDEDLQSAMEQAFDEAKVATAHAENVKFIRLGTAFGVGVVGIGVLEQVK